MNHEKFIKHLNSLLKENKEENLSESSLKEEEAEVFKDVEKLIHQNKAFLRYSEIFHSILDTTEQYFEHTLRALSAIIKITRLGEEKRGLDIVSLCEYILDILIVELNIENSSIMLIGDRKNVLELIAGRGKGDKYTYEKKVKKDLKINLGVGIAGMVAKSGEYIFIPDTSKDKRFYNEKNVAPRALLCAPLVSNDKIIGVINFSHPDPKVFDQNTIQLLLLFSNFIGQSITLNKMYSRIQFWNEELQKEVKEKTKELRLKNRKLEKLAATDPLTHLYNRRFFFERLEEEFNLFLRYNEYFSLFLIDLDNLKPINDKYGHSTGDKVLKTFGKTLRRFGRREDVIGRIGGDEFAYLLLKGKAEEAIKFAERLRKEIASIYFPNTDIKITASIGIASTLDVPFKKTIDLFNAADKALYEAKKQRNLVCRFVAK